MKKTLDLRRKSLPPRKGLWVSVGQNDFQELLS